MSIEYIDLTSSSEEEEHTPMEVIDLTQVDDRIATRTNCRECGYRFEQHNPPLSDRSSAVAALCVGCRVMYETIRKTGEDIAHVRRWLLTGDILCSHYIIMINNDKEKKKITAQVKYMKKRFRRYLDQERTSLLYFLHFPTKNQIRRLVLDSECRCVVTGWICHRAISSQKSWSLTMDHIIPLSKAPPEMNPWPPPTSK